ncbi:MAG TPA: SDR family oxidoreductase [Bryobacteraceae bacterium]|nr:SDR family oxidoreductase [Bryobacteraceae bacterium]
MTANTLDIEDRLAVVIGGTSGIGRALAVGLARHGADVVATGRRQYELDATACEIEALGRQTLRQTADARNRESIDALRDAALARFGRVDILINAAGYTFKEPTVSVDEERFAALMDTHLMSVLRACQSFHAALCASGHGRIINIASLGSFLAFYQVAAYCAAKTAILSLTRSLACEWAEDGIVVNAIAPGVFPTELNRNLVMGTARGQEILMRTPMKRFGRPEELVGLAVLLSSDAVSFLTGQCIAVDGGYLASGVNS